MDLKRVTIQDIANHANVSKSTVSRVLNDTTPVNKEKRAAVLKAIEDLDFEPNFLASGLAGGQSMIIGVQTQKIGSPFYDLLTRGVLRSLSSTRYSPIVVDGFWDTELELQGIRTLLKRQVDGLIIIGGDLGKDQLQGLTKDKPVLIAGREVEGFEDHCLFIDNFQLGYLATQHLLDLGHRSIVHIAGIKSHQDANRRQKGYEHALQQAGIELDPELVFEGEFDGPSGVAAVDQLLDSGKHFTAVFAANDMSAFGARLALYRRGIDVPTEVSVIGVDDQAESPYMTPPLTSVRQPAFEMGMSIGTAMVALIANKPFTLAKPDIEVCVRESTARVLDS